MSAHRLRAVADRPQKVREHHLVLAVTRLPIRMVTARGTAHAPGLGMRRMCPIDAVLRRSKHCTCFRRDAIDRIVIG